MPMELGPLRRRLRLRKSGAGYVGKVGDRAVIAMVTGIGTALAGSATARLLDTFDVEWVVVVGITGAIDDDTPIGALVLPEQVVDGADGSVYRPTPLRVGNAHGTMWTTDELLTDRAMRADLRSRGVVSLDMETAAIAKVCDQPAVAWAVVRALRDRGGDGSVDAEIAGLTPSDGPANRAAVARYLFRHRNALPRLARLAKGSNLAAEQAANAAIMAVTRSINS